MLTLRTIFLSLNPEELLSGIETLQLQRDAHTREMLRIPLSTEVSECEQLIDQSKQENAGLKVTPKTGRKSIVPEEVSRVISFLMHQDPSLCAMGLIPLLAKRYPRKYGIKQRGTLARQVRKWRAQHPEYKRFYPKH